MFHSKKTIKIGLSCSGVGAHCRCCIIDGYMQALWCCPPYVLEQDTRRLIKIGQTNTLCCLVPQWEPGWRKGRGNITFTLNTHKEPPIKPCWYNIRNRWIQTEDFSWNTLKNKSLRSKTNWYPAKQAKLKEIRVRNRQDLSLWVSTSPLRQRPLMLDQIFTALGGVFLLEYPHPEEDLLFLVEKRFEFFHHAWFCSCPPAHRCC